MKSRSRKRGRKPVDYGPPWDVRMVASFTATAKTLTSFCTPTPADAVQAATVVFLNRWNKGQRDFAVFAVSRNCEDTEGSNHVWHGIAYKTIAEMLDRSSGTTQQKVEIHA
jgi:hypothetical protein